MPGYKVKQAAIVDKNLVSMVKLMTRTATTSALLTQTSLVEGVSRTQSIVLTT